MQADSLPIRVGTLDLLYRQIRKFNYGPAHASGIHGLATYICQQKWVNPMEIAKSSYKRLNNCLVAIASFCKVY